MTSGERIKQLRLERNWSQARLAKEVGLHTSSIQDWEAGISLPSAKVLDRLCDLFNTSSDYILCRTDEESISLHGFSPADFDKNHHTSHQKFASSILTRVHQGAGFLLTNISETASIISKNSILRR